MSVYKLTAYLSVRHELAYLTLIRSDASRWSTKVCLHTVSAPKRKKEDDYPDIIYLYPYEQNVVINYVLNLYINMFRG